jgi:hypothetical protein
MVGRGQWSLRGSLLLRWDRYDVKIPCRLYLPALSHSVLLCVARQRGNWLANSLRSLQPQNGPKLPVRFSI